ncbi:metallophosphoesterase family protein [Agrobacterium arsenijevicii]|uniref:Calcineurin-like phosphoesterase domain-containing protein n=1 Tax=Agrobacterium arsenijevicii TaxID=1585697 RepID=A0ABR5DC55_9HYPH|nr:hypothetical protein RP75_06030 [Agrobacterium arsenijevicii]
MVRFLLVSDIHDNLAAVQKMRSQEANGFDALIIVGDIGSNRTREIFDVFATFGCPVLYVYGNWDYKLDYFASFGSGCHHLHLAPFKVGPITFAGFSGCPTHWGRNPEWQLLQKDVDDAHYTIINDMNAARTTAKQAQSDIESKYAASLQELLATSRRKPSRRKLNALDAERRRKFEAISNAVAEIESSEAHRLYRRDRSIAYEEVLLRNRRALRNVISGLSTPKNRIIVVTHERLSKTNVDFEGLPIFLFGHRHGFTETNFRSAQYVNVSVLDRRTLIRPKTFVRGNHFQQFRNLNTGNYAIMEWSEDTSFSVKCVDLEINGDWQECWELETGFQIPDAPFLF